MNNYVICNTNCSIGSSSKANYALKQSTSPPTRCPILVGFYLSPFNRSRDKN